MSLPLSSTQPQIQSTADFDNIETMASQAETLPNENRPYEDDKSLTDEEKGSPERRKDGDTSYEQMTLKQKLSYGGPDMPVWKEICFLFVCCSAQLFTQASLGQTLAPLHIIGNSFGITNPGELSWTIAAYSLTVGTFILIAGRLGDVSFVLNFLIFLLPFSYMFHKRLSENANSKVDLWTQKNDAYRMDLVCFMEHAGRCRSLFWTNLL